MRRTFLQRLFNIIVNIRQILFSKLVLYYNVMLNSLGRGEGKKVREYEVTLDENTSSKISISLLDNKSQQLAQSQLTSDFVPHLFPLGASLMFSKPLSRFVQQSNVPFFSDNPQKEDLLSSGHNKSEEGSTLYY